MKCFVHLESNPVPKAIENAESAFAFAENHLAKDDDEDGSLWRVKWRRDDFYPNNFSNYTYCDLNQELACKGSIVLQLIKDGDETVLGETATIFTADVEKKLYEEAESALDKKEIDIHGLGPKKRRQSTRKKI